MVALTACGGNSDDEQLVASRPLEELCATFLDATEDNEQGREEIFDKYAQRFDNELTELNSAHQDGDMSDDQLRLEGIRSQLRLIRDVVTELAEYPNVHGPARNVMTAVAADESAPPDVRRSANDALFVIAETERYNREELAGTIELIAAQAEYLLAIEDVDEMERGMEAFDETVSAIDDRFADLERDLEDALDVLSAHYVSLPDCFVP